MVGGHFHAQLPGAGAQGGDQARHPPGQPDHARHQEALQTRSPQAARARVGQADAQRRAVVQPERRGAASLGGAPASQVRRHEDGGRADQDGRQGGSRSAGHAGGPHFAARPRRALNAVEARPISLTAPRARRRSARRNDPPLHQGRLAGAEPLHGGAAEALRRGFRARGGQVPARAAQGRLARRAPPRAGRAGLASRAGHGLRGAPARRSAGARARGGDLLHDVPAAARRAAPHRRVQLGLVLGDGRGENPRSLRANAGHPARRDHARRPLFARGSGLPRLVRHGAGGAGEQLQIRRERQCADHGPAHREAARDAGPGDGARPGPAPSNCRTSPGGHHLRRFGEHGEEMTKILSVDWEKPESWLLRTYGDYRVLPKALKMQPQQIVDEVVKSNLRGRGGAGFPTGMKWNFVRKETSFPKYLVVNADEGEPGTFKDREILLRSPHMFVEGLIIGCFALDCHLTYVYCRGEFREGPVKRLQGAIDEAYAKGCLGKNILGSGFDLDMHVVFGAGAYICGEETGLLESLEGRKGYPRLKPPFPANAGGGLFKQPTAVNNVETLANLPFIVNSGGEAFDKIGLVPKNGGTRLFAVSGHVKKTGVFEAPMGISFKALL